MIFPKHSDQVTVFALFGQFVSGRDQPPTVARLERQPAAPCRCRTLGRLAGALGEDPACLTPATQP